MKRANTMSTITVELIIKMKTKFASSIAEKTNGFISRMSEIFTPPFAMNSIPYTSYNPSRLQHISPKFDRSIHVVRIVPLSTIQ